MGYKQIGWVRQCWIALKWWLRNRKRSKDTPEKSAHDITPKNRSKAWSKVRSKAKNRRAARLFIEPYTYYT